MTEPQTAEEFAMESNIEKPTAFKKLLSIFGIMLTYPKPLENIDFYVFAKFFFILGILTLFQLYGSIVHFIQVSNAGSTFRNEMMNDINAFMQCMLAASYLAIFLITGNKILNFLKTLKYSEPENNEDVNTKVENFSVSYYKLMFLMCFVYGLDNTFKNSNCAFRETVKKNSTLVCGSQLPMLFPMHLSRFVQIYLKVVNWFVLMFYFPSALTVPAFGLGSMDILVNRIRFLKRKLRLIRFGKENNTILVRSQLRNCINYYIHIKNLAAEMNNTVSSLFLPQYIVMSTILALLEYQMLTQFNAATVIRFTGWAIVEFVICLKGQNLLNESLHLAECVYNMEWYEMPSEVRSMFKIFHMAVQKPIRFRAKPFEALDSKFLMNVMKNSYSLMMFFRAWSDKI